MAVGENDLQLFASEVMAQNFATADVGGAKSDSLISGAVPGEIFFQMASTGSQQDQFAKVHFYNANATGDLTAAKAWIENSLDEGPSGNFLTELVPLSSAENATKRVRIVGENSSGTPDFERRTLNGAVSVFGGTQMSRLISLELELSSSPVDAPTPAIADDDILVKRNGVTVGKIPAGHSSATCEVDLWLPDALDDDTTIDDAGSEPDGATWSRPRTYEAGADVANGGVLTHQKSQAIFLRWRERAGRLSSGTVDLVLGISGETA